MIKFVASRQRVKNIDLRILDVGYQNGDPVVLGGFIGYSSPYK